MYIMCFLNRQIHKIYKLNNRKKTFLFQMNIIPITSTSTPPENLKPFPLSWKLWLYPAGLPADPLVRLVSPPRRLFVPVINIYWGFSIWHTLCCATYPPTPERSNWFFLSGPRPPEFALPSLFCDMWVVSFARPCSLSQGSFILFIFVSQSLAPCPASSRNSIHVDEWVYKWMTITQCLNITDDQ